MFEVLVFVKKKNNQKHPKPQKSNIYESYVKK